MDERMAAAAADILPQIELGDREEERYRDASGHAAGGVTCDPFWRETFDQPLYGGGHTDGWRGHGSGGLGPPAGQRPRFQTGYVGGGSFGYFLDGPGGLYNWSPHPHHALPYPVPPLPHQGHPAPPSSVLSSRESSRDDLTSMGGDFAGGQMFECEDRFRVDRRKLELMIMGQFEPVNANGRGESAAEFFARIGDQTGTTIIWPSRLKIGAKSKKDPHIRVGGHREDCVRR